MVQYSGTVAVVLLTDPKYRKGQTVHSDMFSDHGYRTDSRAAGRNSELFSVMPFRRTFHFDTYTVDGTSWSPHSQPLHTFSGQLSRCHVFMSAWQIDLIVAHFPSFFRADFW